MRFSSALDRRAIASGLFLPALYWTGVVITITLFGYPGVVCMTPVAWVLGLPVGMRVARESTSSGRTVVLEAATAGGLLGAWQGVLFAIVVTVSENLRGVPWSEGLDPFFVAVLWIVLSTPACAGLAALMAWRIRRLAQPPD